MANTFTWVGGVGNNANLAASWSPAGGPPKAGDTAIIPAGSSSSPVVVNLTSGSIDTNTFDVAGPFTTINDDTVTATGNIATIGSGAVWNFTDSTSTGDRFSLASGGTLSFTDSPINGDTLAFATGDTLDLTGSAVGTMTIDEDNNGNSVSGENTNIYQTGSGSTLLINAVGTVSNNSNLWVGSASILKTLKPAAVQSYNSDSLVDSPGGSVTLDIQQKGTNGGAYASEGSVLVTGGTLVVNADTNSTFANNFQMLDYGGTVASLVQLNARMAVSAGWMDLQGGAHGATLEVNSNLGGGQLVVFEDANATLRIDATNTLAYEDNTAVLASFKGRILGFQPGDTIDLAGLAPTGTGDLTYSYGVDTLWGASVLELDNNGTLVGLLRMPTEQLAIGTGTLTASGSFTGTGNFLLSADGHGGTDITLRPATLAGGATITGSVDSWAGLVSLGTVANGATSDWNTGSLWAGGAVPGQYQAAVFAPLPAEINQISAENQSAIPSLQYVVAVTSATTAGSVVFNSPFATLQIGAALSLSGEAGESGGGRFYQTNGSVDIVAGGRLAAASFYEVGSSLQVAAGGSMVLSGAVPFSAGLGRQALDLENNYNTQIAGGTITAGGAIIIGADGAASLSLEGSASKHAIVTDTYTQIGGAGIPQNTQQASSLFIAGPDTTWTDQGGDSSTDYSGAMLVGGGYATTSSTLDAGGTYAVSVAGGGSGVLSVDDGATLTDASYAMLGVTQNASGTASVSNDAVWRINTGTTPPPNSIVLGTSTIYNGGSTVESGTTYHPSAPVLTVGNGGSGVLSVSSGGTVQLGTVEAYNSFKMSIGNGGTTIAASGTVSVSGKSSLLDTGGGVLAIGNHGSGLLAITGGGTVRVGDGGSTTGISYGAVLGNKNATLDTSGTEVVTPSSGTLSVTGTGTGAATSTFAVQSGNLVIGRDGRGVADINSFGSLAVAAGEIILGGDGSNAGSGPGGTLNVAGGQVSAGGLWITQNPTLTQHSSFDISRGGTVSLKAEGSQSAALTMDSGTGTIDGGTLTLDATGSAFVGDAALTIDNGGLLQFAGPLSMGPGATVSLDGTSKVLIGTNLVPPAAPGQIAIGTKGGGTLEGGGTVDLPTGGSIIDDGMISTESYGYSSLTINGAVSGNGLLYISNASTLQVSGAVASTNTVDFNTVNHAEFGGYHGTLETFVLGAPALMKADITDFYAGATIDITNQTGLTLAWDPGNSTLYVNKGTAEVAALLVPGTRSATTDLAFSQQSDNNGGTDILALDDNPNYACFAAGSRIATLRGDVAVESLRVGDHVRLARGGTAPVRWLGRRSVACARHPNPSDVMPVRVAAHAFGAGQPHRDLLLSPDHAVFADGVLIPVRYLLNGATLVQETVQRVTYWHVELAHHDVLLAEGLACESYLDTGNRGAFANGGEATMLHPDFALRVWERDGCAKLVRDGAILQAVRSELLDRAVRLGFALTDDPDLHLIVDGVPLRPLLVTESLYRFVVPGAAAGVVIASRAAIPREVYDDHPDGRRLGVMLRRITLTQHDTPCDLPLDTLPDGAGFHPPEQNGALRWRWTDGRARMEIPAGFAADVPLLLDLEVAACVRAWLPRLRGAAA